MPCTILFPAFNLPPVIYNFLPGTEWTSQWKETLERRKAGEKGVEKIQGKSYRGRGLDYEGEEHVVHVLLAIRNS